MKSKAIKTLNCCPLKGFDFEKQKLKSEKHPKQSDTNSKIEVSAICIQI